MTVLKRDDAPMVCHGWCVTEPDIAFTELDDASDHVDSTGHDVTMTCTYVWRLTKATAGSEPTTGT